MTVATTQPQAIAPLQAAPRSPSIHLAYLDGIRGLAAFYVLLEHVQLSGLDLVNARNLAPGAGTHLQRFAYFLNSSVLGFGHLAVDVFIVLSGYCLMLPVVASPDRSLRGGLVGYIKRRAWRILPPYYAALGIALAFSLASGAYLMFTPGDLAAHLLLVHNIKPAWLYSINAPMWSIAIEWQIYFVFALLLLPVWRRMGNLVTLIVAFGAGLSALYLLTSNHNFEWACPWYIGLFTFGMVAAACSMGSASPHPQRNPWMAISLVLTALMAFAYLWQRGDHVHALWVHWFHIQNRGFGWPLDVLAGAAAAALLLGLARVKLQGGHWLSQTILRITESRICAVLGGFSYSLYLIHAPMVSFVQDRLYASHLRPVYAYFAIYLLGIPFGLASGYLLYFAVERHFVPRAQKRVRGPV